MLGGMMQSIGVGGTVEASELNFDDQLYIDTVNNRVGIGTTGPDEKLEINGNILLDNTDDLMWKTAGGVKQVVLTVDANDDVALGSNNLDEMRLIVDSGEAVRIDGNGNVGIGTTNPSAKLHVVGDSILIATSQSPTSSGTGVQGEISWDASYLYICTATNTWKRTALTGGY